MTVLCTFVERNPNNNAKLIQKLGRVWCCWMRMLPSRVVVASTRVWPGLRCPSGHCQWPSRATPNHVASHIVRARQDDKEVVYGDAVTAFLDKLLKSEKYDPPILTNTSTKVKNLPLETLKDRVVAGVAKDQWFVTGCVDASLFSDDFRFVDPSVDVQGVQQYAEGVARLFDGKNSQIDVVSASVIGTNQIEVVWRLEATMRLPFNPKIKPYLVTTTYTVDEDGLIVRQEETFSIPGWEIVVSMFAPWIGSPPEPPVSSISKSS